MYIDLEGYESVFSDAANSLNGLADDSKKYISNLNRNTDKGLGDRALAATMGIGNAILEGTAGAAILLDLTTDVTLAINPVIKGTEDGDRARTRVKGTAAAVATTAKGAYEFVTAEDRSARVQAVKDSVGNYFEKAFIEGDLNYTADVSGKLFGVAAVGASARAAQMSRAAGATEAASTEISGNLATVERRLQRLGYDEAYAKQILQAIDNGEQVVVVGENMKRVNAVASMVENAGGEAVTYTPRKWSGVNRNSLEANRSWIRYWALEKETPIIDIGRQSVPRPFGPSPFYGIENRSLNKWGIYTPFK